MKAGIYFTGSGPILLLTSFPSLEDPRLVEKLETKGIKKFIAYEVPEELVRGKYGIHYNLVSEELAHENDLRVLDYDGHHVFYNFLLSDLGPAVYHEQELSAAGG